MRSKLGLFFLFAFVSVLPASTLTAFGQTNDTEDQAMLEDSLYLLANSGEPDTVRLEKIMTFRLRHVMQPDLQFKVFDYAFELSRRNGWIPNQCFILGEKGYVHQMNGSTDEANTCYSKAAQIAEQHRDTLWMIRSYYRQGFLMNGVGREHEAIACWKKVIPLKKDDPKTTGFIAMAIGAAYLNMDSIDLALEYSLKSYDLLKTDTTLNQMVFTLVNLSSIYLNKKDYVNSEYYARLGIDYSLRWNDENNLARCKLSLARINIAQGKLEEGRRLIEEAAPVLDQVQNNYDLMSIAYERYEINRKTGHLLEALTSLEKAYHLRDTLFRLESQQSLDDALEKYNSEKKELEIEKQKLRAENENREKQEAEKSKSRQFYIFAAIIVILLVNAGFVYNRFLLTRKQNKVIEQQKALVEQKKNEADFQRQLVEEKQKEIVDSITYAKRLQQAILPPQHEISRYFQQNFLLYKPKDIVAGDFYFFECSETHVFYAAADCTGHGVPGAMVSIVCSNALTRCVREFGLSDPGMILNKARDLVVETFEKSGQDVKDGMDISLIAMNRNDGSIHWAGANNACWYIENGHLTEIKADKQPIGKSDRPTPFKSHVLSLQKGSMIILVTDGYGDQFGGEKGKKFKNSNLKELLVSIWNRSMEDQKQVLNDTFESWRGNLEQLDDVCVIGVRIG